MTPADIGKVTLDPSPGSIAAQGDPAAADPSETREKPVRPMRADARRNYDKILATARIVFTERGTDSSLDEIAKRAGVGPGTLYRHFPTRAALVDALMQDWTDRVAADADAAIATGQPAREMLLGWFEHFIDHITLHRGAASKICAAMDDPASPMYRKCRVMGEANRRVIEHLDARGELRPGVDPANVMRLVSGVASVADTSHADLDVRPMLEVVVDGIVRA
ncbi:TetR/AcrR family transcriptional regulator [Terrabacter sp. GCM10028922]|uniref:TetR/AcrR family transcriptional regulator n=1 Tax=Terrabacter sp. GCM10028922 TaxID=3273428 RepID=UPI00360FB00C